MSRFPSAMCAARVFALAAWACPLAAVAQSSIAGRESIFAKYSVPEVFKGKPMPLDLSSGDARMYRTRLRDAMRKGPVFAGYYAVATWGCGTGCISLAIVDFRTGKPTFFGTIQEWFVDGDFELSQLTYKLHSSALHVIGDVNEKDDPADRWFVWTGDKFKLIRTTPVKRDAR